MPKHESHDMDDPCGTHSARTRRRGKRIRTPHTSASVSINQKRNIYRCHICDKSVMYRSKLREHMYSHRKEGHDVMKCRRCVHQQLNYTPGQGLGQWDKRCHMCDKYYTKNKSHMRLHMINHKEDGHDIDRCDHCVHLAHTNKAPHRRDTNSPDGSRSIKELNDTDDTLDDDTDDDCSQQQQAEQEIDETTQLVQLDRNEDGQDEEKGRADGDADDGDDDESESDDMATDCDSVAGNSDNDTENDGAAVRIDERAEQGITQEELDRCSRFCYALMHAADRSDDSFAVSSSCNPTSIPSESHVTTSGDTQLQDEGADDRDRGTSSLGKENLRDSNNNQEAAVPDGDEGDDDEVLCLEEPAGVIELSDDEDMGIPLITLPD